MFSACAVNDEWGHDEHRWQIEKQTQRRIVALLRERLHSTGRIRLVKLSR